MPAAYLPYLKTLRRIPKDVILSMATREMDMSFGESCLCGWAVKEAFANGLSAEEIDPYAPPGVSWDSPANHCVYRFGGDYSEWHNLYRDAEQRIEIVEDAFVRRVAECCK